MAKTTPAFAYLRVSGKGQVEGDGFERQLRAIKSYASAQGVRIVQAQPVGVVRPARRGGTARKSGSQPPARTRLSRSGPSLQAATWPLSAGVLTLRDVAGDGRCILTVESRRLEIAGLLAGDTTQRDFSLTDYYSRASNSYRRTAHCSSSTRA